MPRTIERVRIDTPNAEAVQPIVIPQHVTPVSQMIAFEETVPGWPADVNVPPGMSMPPAPRSFRPAIAVIKDWRLDRLA